MQRNITILHNAAGWCLPNNGNDQPADEFFSTGLPDGLENGLEVVLFRLPTQHHVQALVYIGPALGHSLAEEKGSIVVKKGAISQIRSALAELTFATTRVYYY